MNASNATRTDHTSLDLLKIAYHSGSICSVDKFEGSCNVLPIPDNSVYDNTRFMKLYVTGQKVADIAAYCKHSTTFCSLVSVF